MKKKIHTQSATLEARGNLVSVTNSTTFPQTLRTPSRLRRVSVVGIRKSAAFYLQVFVNHGSIIFILQPKNIFLAWETLQLVKLHDFQFWPQALFAFKSFNHGWEQYIDVLLEKAIVSQKQNKLKEWKIHMQLRFSFKWPRKRLNRIQSILLSTTAKSFSCIRSCLLLGIYGQYSQPMEDPAPRTVCHRTHFIRSCRIFTNPSWYGWDN